MSQGSKQHWIRKAASYCSFFSLFYKVNDLKQELESRGQTSKGLKSQLQARLQKLLKAEEDAEGATTEPGDEKAAAEKSEVTKNKVLGIRIR